MPKQKFPSYTNPKLDLKKCPGKKGLGIFARESIAAGEVLSVWAGEIFTGDELAREPVDRQTHGIQVGEDIFQLPICNNDPADFYNHSCNPNAGLDGQICLVAMREIQPGEEICFDYAMSDSTDYDEFECHCGAPNCRGKVTGNDWKIPDLQKRYRGYFMPYLQHRIDGQSQEALHSD